MNIQIEYSNINQNKTFKDTFVFAVLGPMSGLTALEAAARISAFASAKLHPQFLFPHLPPHGDGRNASFLLVFLHFHVQLHEVFLWWFARIFLLGFAPSDVHLVGFYVCSNVLWLKKYTRLKSKYHMYVCLFSTKLSITKDDWHKFQEVMKTASKKIKETRNKKKYMHKYINTYAWIYKYTCMNT